MSQYDTIFAAQVSQNCESAARDYYELAHDLLMKGHEDSVDLLRLMVRPVYYLGISDSEAVYAFIQGIASDKFMNWLASNMNMLEHCLSVLRRSNELEIECREDSSFVVNGKDINDLVAFRQFLNVFFADLGVTEIEVTRILKEELEIAGYQEK